MSLKILIEEKHGKNVLRIEGRLDATSSPAFEEKLSELLSNGKKDIIVDFSKIDYLSSSGMRVMLSSTKKANMQNGSVVFCALHDDVMEIVKMAGFEKILKICSNEDEALKSL